MNQVMGVTQNGVLKMLVSDTTEQNSISRVWDVVEKVRVGMLKTQFSGGLRARPLEVRLRSVFVRCLGLDEAFR